MSSPVNADSISGNREYKRQRVAKACQTCRSMKSKCDGGRPECARCKGYGYSCVYRAHRPRRGAEENQRPGHDVSARLPELCEVVGQQGALLERVISLLPDTTEQDSALREWSHIKSRVECALSRTNTVCVSQTGTINVHGGTPRAHADRSPSYLGEASDVRFFNLVKRVLQVQRGPEGLQREFESYDQGENMVSSGLVELPAVETAEGYIDAYFSTIHLAYPFIPRTVFLEDHQKIRSRYTQTDCDTDTGLALIFTIYAIGAYYTSFPGTNEGVDVLHEEYFLRSLTLTPIANADRSLNQVSLLLARCFYLLIVCRTESCWTTMGQAVRAAQSIGLHVEYGGSQRLTGSQRSEAEKRRRVWYSVYVLDRLLSLQLGRPPAIHDDDFNVPLPSRVADSGIDWKGDDLEAEDDDPSSGDYFLAVIGFSEIVGRVLRSSYCPRRSHVAAENLAKTKDLDRQLVEWKTGLPRRLRFDLGHAFEKSVIFKRQRNMLAIKYHHLRALIHRPYLCYPLLRHLDDSDMALTQSDWPLMSAYEKTCILEARETARLLHGISSERDLVHNFPWWQMISCLVCAGSILLVSSIFAQATHEPCPEFDTAGLYDDAGTCLKVFEALSNNSAGARIARDMMKALKECGARWPEMSGSTQGPTRGGASVLDGANSLESLASPYDRVSTMEQSNDYVQHLPPSDTYAPIACYWPAEIVDSMAWSAQFLDVAQDRRGEFDGMGQQVGQGDEHVGYATRN
ncbi:hypothetical protein HIM_01550 [Hirsutella minnesotensis 3608]|nr:hypothetical protein HIM_01550 [Hirsutella minnesotensis 3608]